MMRTIVVILMLAQLAMAQTSVSPAAASATDVFRKEYKALQTDVDDMIDAAVPGAEILQTAKASYLDEFGIVISLEVMLERPTSSNPFASPRSSAELHTSLAQRRKLLLDKVQQYMKQKVLTLQSVGPTQSFAIVVHLFNPPNVTNIPAQIYFVVKKRDPLKVLIREL